MRRSTTLMLFVLVLSLAAAVASAGAQTVLRVAGWESEASLAPLIEEFEALHPNIKVEYVGTGTDTNTFVQRLLTWIAAGQTPDVIPVSYWHYPMMMENNIFVDLTPFVTAGPGLAADILPEALEAFKTDGRTYAVPFALELMTVIYNPGIFLESGVPLPTESLASGEWNMTTLEEAARKLTRPSEEGFDSIGFYVYRTLPFSASLLWGYGGEVLSEDGSQVLLDTPESLRAIERLASLFQEEKIFVSHYQNSRYKLDYWATLTSWNTAMRLQWISTVGGINIRGISWPMEIVRFPSGPERHDTNLFIAHGWGVTQAADDAQAAWEFVRFMAEVEPREGQAAIPVRQSHLHRWVETLESQYNVPAAEYLAEAATALRLAPRPATSEIETILTNALNRAMMDNVNPRGVIEEAVRTVESNL